MTIEQMEELAEFCERIGTSKRRLADFMKAIADLNPETLKRKQRFIRSMYAQMRDAKRTEKEGIKLPYN